MAKTLHYDFVNDRSLVARTGPTLSITRATDATYLGADGNIATASSGEARFPYDINAQSLGLLVEEARTNICLQSEDFSTTWSLITAAINTDQTLAPDGSLTADQLIDDGLTGVGTITVRQLISGMATTGNYCVSVFAKADQLDWLYLQISNYGSNSLFTYYDLTNGAVGATAGAQVLDNGIEDYGDGWYRCWFYFAADGTDTTGYIRVVTANGDNDISCDRDGTSSIFIWGAQLEVGAFPTSYIPTTTGSVTRNADVVSTSDVSWFDTTEGTMYTDLVPNYVDTGQAYEFMAASMVQSATDYHYWACQTTSSRTGRHLYALRKSAADTIETATDEYASGSRTRAVAAYDFPGSEHAVSANGTTVLSEPLTSTAPTGGVFYVGQYSLAGFEVNGPIKEIAYFDERLPDATLEEYSTNGIPADAARNPYYMAPHKRATAARAPRGRRGRRGGLRDM